MNLYFEEYSNKNAPTIAFIHGGGMDSSIWGGSLDYFRDYHCIVVDLPEHGRSAEIKPFSIKSSVELIAQIIRENSNDKKAYVIGHSLGGVVLINLISRYPELIEQAVIASGNLQPSPLYKIFTNSMVCTFVSFLNRKKYKKEYVTSEMLKRVYKEMILYSRIPDGLNETKVPILLIAGEKEPEFLKKSNRDLLHICQNAKEITILKAKHDYPWIENQLFNEIVYACMENKSISNERIINYETM